MLPDDRDVRDEDLDAAPEDLDDLEGVEAFPDDLEFEPESPETRDPDEPERELLPDVAELPLRSAGLLVVVLGYHSTPLRSRVVERVVVRVPLVVPEDLVVERVPDRVTVERSRVRPPSVYLLLDTVAVRVLTRVAERVGLPVAERVVLLVAARASVRETAPEVAPPVALRPTRTLPSSGSAVRDVERARS